MSSSRPLIELAAEATALSSGLQTLPTAIGLNRKGGARERGEGEDKREREGLENGERERTRERGRG